MASSNAEKPEAKIEKDQINVVLELKLNEIEEDQNQPRKTFDEEKLKTLAESIKTRGVQQPIAVRPKNTSGKYLIIQGARRFRASKLAGKTTIPVIVQSNEQDFDDYAQVVENIQRENLSPIDIAQFIQKRQKAGDSNVFIAKGLGENKSFITRYASLIDAPQNLIDAFEAKRINGIAVFYELFMLWKSNPSAAEGLLTGEDVITKSMILSAKNPSKTIKNPESEHGNTNGDSNQNTTASNPKPSVVSNQTTAGNDENLDEIAEKIAEDIAKSREKKDETIDFELDLPNKNQGNNDAEENNEEEHQSSSADSVNDNLDVSAQTNENESPEFSESDTEPEAKEHKVIKGGYRGNQPEDNTPSTPDPTRIKKPLLLGTHNGDPVEVLLQQKPTTPGLAHIQYQDTMIEKEVAIGEITLTELNDHPFAGKRTA